MSERRWQEEREQLREKALAEHARLHRLYRENRFAFERERKRAIDELINSAEDEGIRKRLRERQALWDERMRQAGSTHNRFVLAQTFFWDHFFENWLPAIRRFNEAMNGESDREDPLTLTSDS